MIRNVRYPIDRDEKGGGSFSTLRNQEMLFILSPSLFRNIQNIYPSDIIDASSRHWHAELAGASEHGKMLAQNDRV